METNPANPVDVHLDGVLIKQLTWKPSVVRNAAIAIINHIGSKTGESFTDEVDLSFIGTNDRNAIGSAWRHLAGCGIIKPTGRFRRASKNAASCNGRKVFGYEMANRRLAQTFLSRNQVTATLPSQGELPI